MQLTVTLTKATKKTPQQLNVKMTGTKDEHNEMAQFQDNFQDSDIRNGFLYMLNQLKEEGGCWPQYPSIGVGYSLAQYDCEGKTATTIKLDKKIEGCAMYVLGAPRGHLNKYTRIK